VPDALLTDWILEPSSARRRGTNHGLKSNCPRCFQIQSVNMHWHLKVSNGRLNSGRRFGTIMSATIQYSPSSWRANKPSKPQKPSCAKTQSSQGATQIYFKAVLVFLSFQFIPIPSWGLHTKAVAKRKRDKHAIGKRLIYLCDTVQDGQTGRNTNCGLTHLSSLLKLLIAGLVTKELIKYIPGLSRSSPILTLRNLALEVGTEGR